MLKSFLIISFADSKINSVLNFVCKQCWYAVCFFYQGFLSRTRKTHRTAGEGRGPFFIPLYHFHPLTNIQIFICNFACEMTITCIYQTATRWDFTTFSHYHLTDWWCEVYFSLFTWWFDTRFLLLQSWYGKTIDSNSHRLSPLYYKQTD